MLKGLDQTSETVRPAAILQVSSRALVLTFSRHRSKHLDFLCSHASFSQSSCRESLEDTTQCPLPCHPCPLLPDLRALLPLPKSHSSLGPVCAHGEEPVAGPYACRALLRQSSPRHPIGRQAQTRCNNYVDAFCQNNNRTGRKCLALICVGKSRVALRQRFEARRES